MYNNRVGLGWRVFCSYNVGLDVYCVVAIINPKVFGGIRDYISAATIDDLVNIEERFNHEAQRISDILGTFSDYNLNRVDYCANFDLRKIDSLLTVEQMMILLKRANIPHHFKLGGIYDKERSHRFKTYKDNLYLKNGSVTINYYAKHSQLLKMDENNPSLEDSSHIIRFEIQCKSRKLYPMKKLLRDRSLSTLEIVQVLLSDERCYGVLEGYYKRVVMYGNYHTLDYARKVVERENFQQQKKERLIAALELVSRCRGIAKAKLAYGEDKEGLDLFRRSLRELVGLRINPVTIPREWGVVWAWGLWEYLVVGGG